LEDTGFFPTTIPAFQQEYNENSSTEIEKEEKGKERKVKGKGKRKGKGKGKRKEKGMRWRKPDIGNNMNNSFHAFSC